MDPEPSSTVSVRVLFFARAREITQANECDIELSASSSAPEWHGSFEEFIGRLEETYRGLGEIRGAYTLAVNQEYIQKDEKLLLRSGDEVALITAISGG